MLLLFPEMFCWFYLQEEEKEEYRSVGTLLFFVGYSRSRHTLLASLLDGHPHMVVANERNLFYRLRHGGQFKRSEMFDMLVQGSKGFLRGGKGMVMSGNLQNTTHFGFWMEGYWQGAYDKYIEVIMHHLQTGSDVLFRTYNFRTLFFSSRTNFGQKFLTLNRNITIYKKKMYDLQTWITDFRINSCENYTFTGHSSFCRYTGEEITHILSSRFVSQARFRSIKETFPVIKHKIIQNIAGWRRQ